MENRNWDFCKSLTKEELIIFLKETCWCTCPTQKEIDLFQWEHRSKKILREQREFHDRVHPIKSELAKKIDDLGAKYNASTDNNEKLQILNERGLLFEKFTSFDAEDQRIEKRYAENEKLLKKYRSQES